MAWPAVKWTLGTAGVLAALVAILAARWGDWRTYAEAVAVALGVYAFMVTRCGYGQDQRFVPADEPAPPALDPSRTRRLQSLEL